MSKKKPNPPEESSDLFGGSRQEASSQGKATVLPRGFGRTWTTSCRSGHGTHLQGGLVHGPELP